MNVIDKLLLVVLVLALVILAVCLLQGVELPQVGDLLGIADVIEGVQ